MQKKKDLLSTHNTRHCMQIVHQIFYQNKLNFSKLKLMFGGNRTLTKTSQNFMTFFEHYLDNYKCCY